MTSKTKRKIKGKKLFISIIIRWIDKRIITPITKFIIFLSEKFNKRTDRFEKWLVKKNTLIMLSLLLAITMFFVVNSKAIVLVDSTAEVLYDQKLDAIYNSESYVVEGLPETVDVTLIGRKVDMYLAKQLSKGTVTVDISNLKEGTHKVTLNYESVINSVEYKLDPSTVTVIVYPKVSTTKSASIDLINKESLSSKLSISNVTLDQTEIIIKGSKNTISDVATVRALVDISKLIDPEAGVVALDDIPLIAYNSSGKVMNVEMVPSTVSANINIESPSKEVPIKVIPKGEVQFGKAISSISSSDSKVIVYGDKNVISQIEYIPIEVDVTNLSTNKDFNVTMTMPNGVRDLSVKSTKVSVSLGDAENLEINDIMIETINLDSNYKAAAIGSTSIKTTVVVKGTKEVLSTIDPSTIKAVVDLSGYKEGDHEVPILITGDDLRVIYTPKTTKIKIRISKK